MRTLLADLNEQVIRRSVYISISKCVGKNSPCDEYTKSIFITINIASFKLFAMSSLNLCS
jgi:hypothetical protein